VGDFECKFQTEGVSENYSDFPFVWYQNICSALFGCVKGRVWWTDRWTDRITTPKTALA